MVLLAGGGAYPYSRYSSLQEQGPRQVEKYLRTELPARLVRERGAHGIRPKDLEAVQNFEIVEFATHWFPRDKTRVRVEVRTPVQDFTYHFTFKRRFGSWVLNTEVRAGVFGP